MIGVTLHSHGAAERWQGSTINIAIQSWTVVKQVLLCSTIGYHQFVHGDHISCSHENVTESHRIVTPANFTFRSAYNDDERVRLIGISAIVCDINV